MWVCEKLGLWEDSCWLRFIPCGNILLSSLHLGFLEFRFWDCDTLNGESNSWKLWDPYHHDSCCFSDAPTSQRKFKKLVKVQKCSVNVILLIVINTSLYTVTKNSHLMRNSLYEWCGLYWRLFCCCLAYFLTDFLNIGSKILMHSQTYLKILRLPTTIQTFLLLYL